MYHQSFQRHKCVPAILSSDLTQSQALSLGAGLVQPCMADMTSVTTAKKRSPSRPVSTAAELRKPPQAIQLQGWMRTG